MDTVTRGSRTRSLDWTICRMPQSMGELEYEQQQQPPRNSERTRKKKEKRWTLGSLFRRKKVKDSDTDSSDSDAAEDTKKGGFLARRRRRRRSANRGSKDVSQSFEHVILRPSSIVSGGPGNAVNIDGKKSLKARVEASRDSLLKDSSSEDECSPRPRAPRSKRSSRDLSDSNMKVLELDSSPRSSRWTAKVVYCESSDYEARFTAHTRSATSSPAQSPIAKVKHLKRPPIPQSNNPRPLHCQKSASFDLLPRHTLQQQQQQQQHHHSRIPPPPPPRDPQRKIIPPLGYQQERPSSYAFESNQPISKVMMDHNSNHITAYKVNSNCSLDQPVYKMSSSGSLDQRRNYQYYTDQQPRSRRPIHIARIDQPYLSDSQISRMRTNDWRIPRDSNSSLCDSSDSREGAPVDVRPLSMVMEATEQPQQDSPVIKKDQKRKSGNLEDALNELEAIYKSLQLRDEEPPSRGFESDSGYNYRVVDDMAYRRLHRKESGESPDFRRVMSQAGSYLLVSPTLSPPPFANAPPVPPPQNEPDITLDDVVYRNIRHTNNSLKVADPQPPFGIPIGLVTPAPNSDYLHATPKQLYRPTFKPRKTPDIVKDDLAYRNLRKDGQRDSLLTAEDNIHSDNLSPSILKKKRAVRSLSANLLSIIQKEHIATENQNNKNYNYDGDYFEKTQSYSYLPDVITSRYKRSQSSEISDASPQVSKFYSDLPISTTSTETLTDSRANIMNGSNQESCSNRFQYVVTDKPLPKTDFIKLRLPSPHQISQPKIYPNNVDTNISGDYYSERYNKQLKPNYINQINYCSSSPNNSLKTRKSLNSVERSHSRSPSVNYNDALLASNGSKSPSTYGSIEKKFNEKNNVTSVSFPIGRVVLPEKNEASTNFPGKNLHESSQKNKSGRLTSEISPSYCSDYDYYCNNKHNNFNFSHSSDNSLWKQATMSNESADCDEQNPRIQEQHAKDRSLYHTDLSSPYIGKPNKNLNEIEKCRSQSRSPLPQASVSRNDNNKSSLNKHDTIFTISSSLPTENNTNQNSMSPETSVMEKITGKVPQSTVLSQIVLTSASNITGNSNNHSNLDNQSDRLIKEIKPSSSQEMKASFVLDTSNTKSSVSESRVPSPRLHVYQEKLHQKNEPQVKEISSDQCIVSGTSETNKDDKPIMPRPRSFMNLNKNNSLTDKSKVCISNSTLSVTSDNINESTNCKIRIPSPNSAFNLNSKILSENRNKSKSSSPCTSIKSSSNEITVPTPSPRLSLTPERSPLNKRRIEPLDTNNLLSSNEKMPFSDSKNNKNVNFILQSTEKSVKTADLNQQFIQEEVHNFYTNVKNNTIELNKDILVGESNVYDNELSQNTTDDLMNNTKICKSDDSIDTAVDYGEDESFKSKDYEVDTKSSLNTDSMNTDKLPLSKLNLQKKKDDPVIKTTVSSGYKTEKDLNELISEINHKQGEILTGRSTNVLAETPSTSSLTSDKKDNLILGKITPHKPVKLTTFSINENNIIENNETIIVPNEENDIIGTSESMTDLLRELTRSLDQDFGCLNVTKSSNDEGDDERTTLLKSNENTDNLNEIPSVIIKDEQEISIDDDPDDKEVMEINRVVLSEIEENVEFGVNNITDQNNRSGIVHEEVKCKEEKQETITDTTKCKNGLLNNTLTNSSETSEDVKAFTCTSKQSDDVNICDVKQSCNTDDSDAEFVEAICKTASELSALSSTSSSLPTTSSAMSSHQSIQCDNSLMMTATTATTEKSQWKRHQPCDLDRNEGSLVFYNRMFNKKKSWNVFINKSAECFNRLYKEKLYEK
ncbi:uncharacterized protein LOC142326441 isoform X9 [Lycorma delicatula]|uniref:uncharacterized protein LOC142326441 isoform X9 n=1 Tax=Lycorma delicatula TaxID=130591 RepID=UPI003F50D82F